MYMRNSSYERNNHRLSVKMKILILGIKDTYTLPEFPFNVDKQTQTSKIDSLQYLNYY